MKNMKILALALLAVIISGRVSAEEIELKRFTFEELTRRTLLVEQFCS